MVLRRSKSGLLALSTASTSARRAAGAAWQAPIKAFSNQGFDHGLATDIQAGRLLIKFFEHFRGEIYIHPLNGIHHLSASEKPGDVLTAIRHLGNPLGADWLLFFKCFLHRAQSLLSWPSRASRDGRTPPLCLSEFHTPTNTYVPLPNPWRKTAPDSHYGNSANSGG
jgi:hypothetical protein